jgi:hypothetical protein
MELQENLRIQVLENLSVISYSSLEKEISVYFYVGQSTFHELDSRFRPTAIQ